MAIARRPEVTQTVNTTSSKGVTIAKPSTTAAGDVMLAFITVNAENVAITAPSGWTQIQQLSPSANSLTIATYYHVAGAS